MTTDTDGTSGWMVTKALPWGERLPVSLVCQSSFLALDCEAGRPGLVSPDIRTTRVSRKPVRTSSVLKWNS